MHIPVTVVFIPGHSRSRPEPGRDLGERLALAQVDEDQQGLLPGVQLPPGRPDRDLVPADDPGQRSAVTPASRGLGSPLLRERTTTPTQALLL